MDAAATIAALKGDDIDQLLGDFVTGYVTENLHVLTQKAQENSSGEHEIDPMRNDPATIPGAGGQTRRAAAAAQASEARYPLSEGGVNDGRDQDS